MHYYDAPKCDDEYMRYMYVKYNVIMGKTALYNIE